MSGRVEDTVVHAYPWFETVVAFTRGMMITARAVPRSGVLTDVLIVSAVASLLLLLTLGQT